MTAKCFGGIIDHARIKSIMPQNERTKELQKYKNPVLMMAAQMDCLFPAKGYYAGRKKCGRRVAVIYCGAEDISMNLQKRKATDHKGIEDKIEHG